MTRKKRLPKTIGLSGARLLALIHLNFELQTDIGSSLVYLCRIETQNLGLSMLIWMSSRTRLL